jgi:hypothetical protein
MQSHLHERCKPAASRICQMQQVLVTPEIRPRYFFANKISNLAGKAPFDNA